MEEEVDQIILRSDTPWLCACLMEIQTHLEKEVTQQTIRNLCGSIYQLSTWEAGERSWGLEPTEAGAKGGGASPSGRMWVLLFRAEGAKDGLCIAAQSKKEWTSHPCSPGAWPSQLLSGLFILQLKPESSIFLRELTAFPEGGCFPAWKHWSHGSCTFRYRLPVLQLTEGISSLVWSPPVCDWWPLRECPNEAETSLAKREIKPCR